MAPLADCPLAAHFLSSRRGFRTLERLRGDRKCAAKGGPVENSAMAKAEPGENSAGERSVLSVRLRLSG